MLVAGQAHSFSASIIIEVFVKRNVVSKFTEEGFGKIKFVWDIRPLIGKEFFRFASFIGFEKGVQSSCPSQKLHYIEKVYISRPERYKVICFFDDGCFLFSIKPNKLSVIIQTMTSSPTQFSFYGNDVIL